jgi:hypothetical protein
MNAMCRCFTISMCPTPFVLFVKIKREMRLWVIVGAKRLDQMMSGEYALVFSLLGSCTSLSNFSLINLLGQRICPCFKNNPLCH